MLEEKCLQPPPKRQRLGEALKCETITKVCDKAKNFMRKIRRK